MTLPYNIHIHCASKFRNTPILASEPFSRDLPTYSTVSYCGYLSEHGHGVASIRPNLAMPEFGLKNQFSYCTEDVSQYLDQLMADSDSSGQGLSNGIWVCIQILKTLEERCC